MAQLDTSSDGAAPSSSSSSSTTAASAATSSATATAAAAPGAAGGGESSEAAARVAAAAAAAAAVFHIADDIRVGVDEEDGAGEDDEATAQAGDDGGAAVAMTRPRTNSSVALSVAPSVAVFNFAAALPPATSAATYDLGPAPLRPPAHAAVNSTQWSAAGGGSTASSERGVAQVSTATLVSQANARLRGMPRLCRTNAQQASKAGRTQAAKVPQCSHHVAHTCYQ